MSLGASYDTRVRHAGEVELASRNLLSNPDLKDIDEEGPEGVKLLSGPEATGRHIYARRLRDELGAAQRDTRLTKQNSAPAPLQGNCPLSEPIIEGSEPPDPSARAPLPAPPAPEVEIVASAKKGFAAGWVGVAICWITGNPRRAGSMRFTTASEQITVQVGQGNYIRLYLPQIPEGVSGIGILATPEQEFENSALNQTLYFQRILDARTGVRNPYPLTGPHRKRSAARTANETYIGAFGSQPGPRLNYGPLPGFTLRTFQSRISYQVRTPAGESADQQVTDIDTTGKGEATAKRSFGSGLSTVTYTARKSGAAANRVRVSHATGGAGTGISVESSGIFPNKLISVTYPAGTTARDVARAVEASTAVRWVRASTPFNPANGEAVAGSANLAGGISGGGRGLMIRLPRRASARFPGATEWRLKFEGPDGLWYAENWQAINTKAVMISNNPKDYHPSNEPEQADRKREDETGIPAPDSELEEPEAFGPTLPLPGTYAIRESLEAEGDDNKESPPSPATVATIAQGQYMRVLPSQVGNRLPNAEMEDIDPETGDPVEWVLNRDEAKVLYVDAIDNALVIRDLPLAKNTTVAAAAIAPRRSITDAPQAMRVVGEMTRYVSGSLSVNARYFNAAGTFTSSQVLDTMRGASATMDAEVSVGLPGSGAQYIAPADTDSVTFAIALNGATGDARDFDAELKHFGIWRGLAAPRKRTEGIEPDIELAGDKYPAGPYSVLLEDAKVANGQTVNAVEYYASHGTPANPDSLLSGYATPLVPGQGYTPSLHVSYSGVSVATALLTVAIKDLSGRTIQMLPPLVPGVLGSQADTPIIAPTFTTPDDAAYMEIVRGDASDGRVSVWAFQLDEGAATSYTAENALTGTHTATLDTRTPKIDEDPRLPWLSVVREWRDGRSIFTEDPLGAGTDVTLEFRSADEIGFWGAWGTFEDTPKLRYWQIRATLISTDATLSPRLSWLGLELVRPQTLLLRPDGTEYPGAAQATNISGPHPLPLFESVLSDSNVSTRRSRGRPRDQRKLDIQTYVDETLALIMEDIASGQPLIIEGWDLQKRLGVVLEPPEFDVDRYKALRGHDDAGRAVPPTAWIHDVEGLSCEVLSEEDL